MSEESGLGDDVAETDLDLEGKPEVNKEKHQNLLKRQNTYGDITQNATPEELENLLRYHDNNVPDVSFETKSFGFFTVHNTLSMFYKERSTWSYPSQS